MRLTSFPWTLVWTCLYLLLYNGQIDFCRKEQNSFDNILVRDAFEYVLARNCLRPMVLPTDRPNIIFGRYRVQKLLRWITSSEVCLWSFFVCLCLPVTRSGPIRLAGDRFLDPLFKTLIGPDIDPILKLISPKRFRQARLIELLQKIPLSSPI